MGINLNAVQIFWAVKFISLPQFPRRVIIQKLTMQKFVNQVPFSIASTYHINKILSVIQITPSVQWKEFQEHWENYVASGFLLYLVIHCIPTKPYVITKTFRVIPCIMLKDPLYCKMGVAPRMHILNLNSQPRYIMALLMKLMHNYMRTELINTGNCSTNL